MAMKSISIGAPPAFATVDGHLIVVHPARAFSYREKTCVIP